MSWLFTVSLDVSAELGNLKGQLGRLRFAVKKRVAETEAYLGDPLPWTFDEAKAAMGLTRAGCAFPTDVLRIEISGPENPHLTVVDIPGLVHSENTTQTSMDIETVSNPVGSYIKFSRSIILAVVSAQNDYADQVTPSRSRHRVGICFQLFQVDVLELPGNIKQRRMDIYYFDRIEVRLPDELSK